MKKADFERIVTSYKGLTADGFEEPSGELYEMRRRDFLNSAIYLQHCLDAERVLRKFQPTTLMTKWQYAHSTPENLIPLIEWYCGRSNSLGSIIVAALQLGFALSTNTDGKVCMNIFALQLEGELRDFKVRQLIQRAAGC